MDAALARLVELVRRTFGFSSLRPDQELAVRASLAGRDALVVLPTGGGKSLCYQAPALVREGLTVVVSPLISLMKDQLDGLVAHGVAAGMLTSLQEPGERAEVYRALEMGRLKLLFAAPERIALGGFLEQLRRWGLAALAVDEAHCISHWGHDFRPEYRRLGEVRRLWPEVPIQAFTATATPRVRADVCAALGLRDPVEIVGDFDRPNLCYRVRPRGDLVRQVHGVVARHSGRGGIVYCQRRADTERLARSLASLGVRTLPYHAGLEAGRRRRAQEAFQNESIEVVVATVAFGMGIDRPDVRFVVHAGLPKGVEQYSQETGRAGRDGLASECVMFYGGSDVHGWRNLIERGAREAEEAGNPDAMLEMQGAIDRLNHVWNLAAGATCRHRLLVEYFGGRWRLAEGESCGACDVCLGELRDVADSQVVAQKILSCVVRCEQRYGAAHVADVLRGAETERIRGAGHDRLSTFGLLSGHSAPEIRVWIEQLLALGHLATTRGDYPTLYLTQSGAEVARGERPVRLFLPERPPRRRAKASPPPTEVAPADATLFEALRSLRRRLARERAVPPYILFNDQTLAQLAASRPRTRDELLAIRGIGEKKADDLGPAFLAAVAEYE